MESVLEPRHGVHARAWQTSEQLAMHSECEQMGNFWALAKVDRAEDESFHSRLVPPSMVGNCSTLYIVLVILVSYNKCICRTCNNYITHTLLGDNF